jgi:hypothetical protein
MLFYVWNDAVYAMDVRSDGVTFAAGTPRRLFTRTTGCAPNRCYDVAPDGRFLMNTTMAELRHESVTRMDLILNWTSTLPK